jgi:hypothetical protein
MIKVEYEGWEELTRGLRKAKGPLMKLAGLGMARTVHRFVKAEAPRRTGELAEGIIVHKIGPYAWEIKATADYDKWVRQRTRPHFIMPRVKKALWWPGLAHPVPWVGPPYTKRHPGTKANLYMQRGADKAKSPIMALAQKLGADIVREIGG